MKNAERNEALLIVNVQNGFINFHTKHLPARIDFLSSWFETVIVSQYYNCSDSNSDDLISSVVDWSAIKRGSVEFAHAFDVPRGAILRSGHEYSVVTNDLKEILRSFNVYHIHIAGMDTDISIRICASELLKAGFCVSVHGDYCASTLGPWCHERALRKMAGVLAISPQSPPVSTLPEALGRWCE